MRLSLKELESYHAGLSTGEAVALVVAAMAAWEAAGRVSDRLPDSECFVLASDGTVSLTGPMVDAVNVDPVVYFAQLLRRLRGLARGEQPGAISGALLLLIARASGEVDLPSPSFAAFRAGLTRFQSMDPVILASVYRRISRRRQSSRTGRAALLLTGCLARHRVAVAACLGLATLSGFLGLKWTGGTSGPMLVSADRVTVNTETVTATVFRESPLAVAAPAPTVSTDVEPGVTRNTVAIRPVLSSSLVGADVFSPSFAHHGGTLLFHTGRSGSALMQATFDRNGLPVIAPLVNDGATNFHATVSPDGEWLAYDSDREGTRGVYLTRLGGRDTRNVSGDGYAAVPRWSPDGRQLAFTKAEPAHPRVWNVWLYDLATGALRRISHHRVGQAWGASWFPDGLRLAYSVEDTLVVVNLENGTRQTYVAPRKSRLLRTPAVSPDGTRIVFQVYRDGVWILNVSSGRMKRILTDPSAEEFAWSPDGRRVVFHTRRRGAWSVWEFQINTVDQG